jgi:hypothetical protein
MKEEEMEWQPIETAPRDGRLLLMTDGKNTCVCYPKALPRPVDLLVGEVYPFSSRAGDVWEYFRDEVNAPGHSWSMRPTHWMPLPPPPTPPQGDEQ